MNMLLCPGQNNNSTCIYLRTTDGVFFSLVTTFLGTCGDRIIEDLTAWQHFKFSSSKQDLEHILDTGHIVVGKRFSLESHPYQVTYHFYILTTLAVTVQC